MSWGVRGGRTLDASGSLPQQTERVRKIQLYHMAIDAFEQGQVWLIFLLVILTFSV